MPDHTEHIDGWKGSPWRVAAWVAAALLLLLPLVAMQFTDQVDWSVGDFVFAGLLLFGSLGAYEVIARKSTDVLYRAGVGLGVGATFLLLWVNAAVYITDSAADGLYYGAALVGIVGVVVALFRPGAGAGAMLTAVAALVLACVATLATGLVPNPYVSVAELVGLTGFYAVLYAGAGWLLREADRRGSGRSVA